MTVALTHHKIRVNTIQLHYVTAGQGEPIILLHGWPQTWYAWRHLIPLLATKYQVIAPDLRGMGDSDKPVIGYDKQTLSEDIYSLVKQLQLDPPVLVGHDFGAAVAYAYASSYPQEVRGLVMLEMLLPGFGLEQMLNFTEQENLWHLSFHCMLDLPELLIHGREADYLMWLFRRYAYNPDAIEPSAILEYVSRYRSPGVLRASLMYFRTLFEDARRNQSVAAQTPLIMPILALDGADSLGEKTWQCMQQVAKNVHGGSFAQCGHWVAEEQPAALYEQLDHFVTRVFASW